MGSLLAADGAAPPAPAIVCLGADGHGWAWHEARDRRGCLAGVEVAASPAIVAAAIDGRELSGIDRCLAILALREEAGVSAMRRLFPRECPQCGRDHEIRASKALRVVTPLRDSPAYAHEDAHEALRRAFVPERYLYQPLIIRPDRSGKTRSEAEVNRIARYAGHLPVYVGDPSHTRIAQISYAIRYESRRNRR